MYIAIVYCCAMCEMCGVQKMTHCGIAHGGWRVVVWLVYRWQLARPLFGVRLCSVYLCLVSLLTSQCVCAWCAANDYLSIAQFETVIGLHPTIYIVTWCWPWWGHILTWEGLIAFWNTLRSKWSTFPSQKLLRHFFEKMCQTVWQFFRENVEPFYPRSNSCQHVGTGSNIVQMQIHKHKIDFVYKSDTSSGNKMHQKLPNKIFPPTWPLTKWQLYILHLKYLWSKSLHVSYTPRCKGKGQNSIDHLQYVHLLCI